MKKIIVFLLMMICSIFVCCTKKPQLEKELLSIEVNKPEAITVFIGETYQPSSIVVIAVYKDERVDVTSSATFSKVDTSTLGKKQVEVTYKTKTTSYEIEVIKKNSEFVYMFRIKEKPTKLRYYVNEKLDLTGLKLIMLKNDVEEIEIGLDLCEVYISLNGITKELLDEVGSYKLTFSFRHMEKLYTAELYIDVVYNNDNLPKDKLVVDERKSKLIYWLNETFDPTSLLIYIEDEKSLQKVPVQSSSCTFKLFYNGIEIEDFRFRNTGAYILQMEYASLKGEVEIIVKYRTINKKLVLNIEQAKTTFRVGESFSSSGLVIAYYEDDVLKRYVSSINCNFTLKLNGIEMPMTFKEPGTYSVMVEYEGISEGYKIAVI